MKKLFDGLTKLLAFLTICLYIVLAANAIWPFISDPNIISYLELGRYYAPFVLVGLVCIEIAVSKPFLIQLVIYILVAAATIMQFFPDTFNAIRTAVGF